MSTNKIAGGLLFLIALSIAGCSNKANAANAAPTIVGVKDAQCIVNTQIDFLDGVAALDKEDGDITPNLEIIITPHVDVIDGFATFTKAGEYNVEYKIKDSEGRESKKRSYVDVVTREEYVSFAMPDGFYSERHGKATFEKCGMINGDFVVKAKNHQVAEDVQIKRKFTLKSNFQYNFVFEIEANCAGKIKALADDVECAEMKLVKGHNVISFKHIVLSEEENEDVVISLCFGGIQETVDLIISKLDVQYKQKEDEDINLTTEYSFNGRVLRRIEDTAEGNCWAEDNGKTAVLEITKTTPSIWLGGMFISTDIELKPGISYTVSFDLLAEHKDRGYEVFIQNDRWDALEIVKMVNPTDGHYIHNINITDANRGTLWLYVQSGTNINRVRLKNLEVVQHLPANTIINEEISIQDFVERHDASQHVCSLTSAMGNFTYTIGSFAAVDGEQKVTSPTFFISGSGGNYVLSFKVKASAPIEMVVATAVPVAWDPTISWNKYVLPENEEVVYTVICNKNGSDQHYEIVWQFGSVNNQKYHDVKVEVSDISISLRNRELDG